MHLLTGCDILFVWLFYCCFFVLFLKIMLKSMCFVYVLCMFGSKLAVALPEVDYMEIPAGWWDAEADKSLLIGVHKHGRSKILNDGD